MLLVHYSAYAPKLRGVLDMPQRKLLISHNITPARWFWDHDPQAGGGLRARPQAAAAVRRGGRRRRRRVALQRARVRLGRSSSRSSSIPPGSARRARRRSETWTAPAAPTILFVGRLAPHKRQDAVIRAFELYRRRHAPDARLVLVGAPINWAYDAAMRALAEELSPGRVTIESGLTREQLAERWRSAHAFLCLSEHEGFCIPLLEAFHFGVPVIARAIGGVPEVAGDAALLLDDADDESVAAELLALAVGDGELRATLRARGAARVAAYAPSRPRRRCAARSSRLPRDPRCVPKRTYWHSPDAALDDMTSPRVVELPRRLEPVSRDTFLGAGSADAPRRDAPVAPVVRLHPRHPRRVAGRPVPPIAA